MKKIAIYTAVIGGYDDIRQPKVVDERFDYYLFTDHVETDFIGVWRLMSIPYSNPDRKLVSGYIKTHPKELLPDYEATLWMDSSILIMDNYIYGKIDVLYKNGIDLASVKHPLRDCIYEEAYAVLNKKYETPDKLYKWCHRLYTEGYPVHNGLYESGILYRKNNNEVEWINKKWWECLQLYIKRDQLALNYCLWGAGVNTGYVLPEDEHCRNSDHFIFIEHVYGIKKKQIKLTNVERIRTYIRNKFPNNTMFYKLFFLSIQKSYKLRLFYETLEFICCVFIIPAALYKTIKNHL